jgi:hypothetical protein
VRIKDLQFGYTLPARLSQNAYMERLRIFVSAQNLLTFTKYPGFDPEIGAGGVGVDKGIYPQARTYTIGVNVHF